MKILLVLFILFFSSSLFAEDIHDFQIEEMSIGDSLLDHYSKNKIKSSINNSAFYYENKEYMIILIEDSFFETYHYVQITLKPNDNEYIIHAITGKMIYERNTEQCNNDADMISEEIKKILSNDVIIYKHDKPHSYDKTGKSIVKGSEFKFILGDYIMVTCTDWSNNLQNSKNFPDSEVKVDFMTKEYTDFLKNRAYK